MRIIILVTAMPLVSSCGSEPYGWGRRSASSQEGYVPPSYEEEEEQLEEPIVEPRCPVAGMVYIEGIAEVTLGNPNCDQFPNTLRETDYTIEEYCMFDYPFPGPGITLTPENNSPAEYKLSYGDVERVASGVEAYGLRLCTVAETLYASSGPQNLPFTYGNERVDKLCSVDGDEDGGKSQGYADPIGSHEECVSPLGVHDFGTRGTWQLLDEATATSMREDWEISLGNQQPDPDSGERVCPLPKDCSELGESLEFLVCGDYGPGTNTSSDNRGCHWHLVGDCAFYDQDQFPDGSEWSDDHLRLCSEAGSFDPDADKKWWTVVRSFIASEDYAVLWE